MSLIEVKVVCLDLDDTLVDARGSWHAGFAEVTNHLLERSPKFSALGSPEEIYEQHLRPRIIAAQRKAGSNEWSNDFAREGFRELLRENADLGPTESDSIFNAYLEAWPRYLRLFDDVLEALEALQKKFRLALISNGIGHEQRRKLDRFSLNRYFDVCVISEEIGITKPDPRIFKYALQALDIEAVSALHAGDNLHHDVAGARDYGMYGVWVNRRGGRFEGPNEADAEVRDLNGLVRLLIP